MTPFVYVLEVLVTGQPCLPGGHASRFLMLLAVN